ncbi:hypothetical protein KHS38_05110 [Mucilaginibacter sp. Bleaf8]|uniref:hypothetical protein n=1 Tax=Mucilaginibacter sp. Bleaf8 TaxID=2834430 RepID=UPI001BCACAF6|nr:hypothetical protein [Mucilaginibacter sp. Bleaf8]MBS7563775.1 hypothetical protein [Mucilaginibacter sp. Bleaf8]
MPNISEQQLVDMLQEQIIKKAAFDHQMQQLRLDVNPSTRRHQRSSYIRTLASHLTQINLLLDLWADTFELDLDKILE